MKYPKTKLTLVLALFILTSGVTKAATINFEFTGTVTYGGSLATIGNLITGEFSYDTSALPFFQFGNTAAWNFAEYRFQPPFGISASFNGHTVTANDLNVKVTKNFGGNVEDSVNVIAFTPLVDGNLYPEGAIGFNLGSRNANVLTDTSLPTFFNLAAFDAPNPNFGFLQGNGSSNGALLQFSIDSIQSIPVSEPSSFMLIVAGILSVSRLFRRLRAE